MNRHATESIKDNWLRNSSDIKLISCLNMTISTNYLEYKIIFQSVNQA